MRLLSELSTWFNFCLRACCSKVSCVLCVVFATAAVAAAAASKDRQAGKRCARSALLRLNYSEFSSSSFTSFTVACGLTNKRHRSHRTTGEECSLLTNNKCGYFINRPDELDPGFRYGARKQRRTAVCQYALEIVEGKEGGERKIQLYESFKSISSG